MQVSRNPLKDQGDKIMTNKLTKRAIYTAIWLASTVTAWITSSVITAQASEYSPVEQAYSQLVTDDLPEATIYTNEDLLANNLDFFAAIFSLDKKDTLYDGELIEVKGTWQLRRTGENTYVMEMLNDNKLTKETLDPFIDMLIAEVNQKYDLTNATKREKFYNIASYITDTFSYDYDRVNAGEIAEDVITSYYGDRKLTCKGYALLTYLMCNKCGIDCEFMSGEEHVYNMVRFSEDEPYYGVDLTSIGYLNPGIMLLDKDNLYHVDRIEDDAMRKYNATQNEGKEYVLAPAKEYVYQSAYLLSNGRIEDFIKFDAITVGIVLLLVFNLFLLIKFIKNETAYALRKRKNRKAKRRVR